MRIAIDARAYGWAGVGRYTRNLLTALAAIDVKNTYQVVIGDAKVAKEIECLGEPGQFRTTLVESSYYSWREQVIFLRQLYAIKADLFHFTHFNVPLFFRRPYVVTIHDITRFLFPGQRQQSLFKQLLYEQVFAHAVRAARAVICVSDTTRLALQALPLRLPKLVSTVYEGVGREFTPAISSLERQRVRMLVGTQDPYVLYVGVWMSHKNLPRVLRAYRELLRFYPTLSLVLTGKPKPGYVAVDKVAHELELSSDQVVYLGFVSDEQLPALYAEAACLLFPSLYEGFGLPALEAAACGTPVVVSHVSSFPEIMGLQEAALNAAVFVNPESVQSIVDGAEHVLRDAVLRKQLIDAGTQRAALFSWRQCAEDTVRIYHQAKQAP